MKRYFALLVFVFGCARPIATVDGVAIDGEDAEMMRALFQPPPSEDGSARLAVDAALAHRLLYGWLAGSSAKARRDAYAELATALRKSSATPAEQASKLVAVLDVARCRFIDHGEACGAWAVKARPAPRRLRRYNVNRPLRVVQIGDLEPTPLPLEYLEPRFADAVERLAVGESVTVDGVQLRLTEVLAPDAL